MLIQQNSPVFFSNTVFDVVALATSAGGLATISQILAELPADFPAAIVVLQHLYPKSPGLLPDILRQRTLLKVKSADSGESLRAGTVYVARPDWHLMINADATLTLTQTERVNYTRPAADVLFNSLAESCKQRGIAVVLTGKGKDGATGIQQVKAMGGTTIVQDQRTAEHSGMPSAAIQTQAIDFVLTSDRIASTLIKLVNSEQR